MQNYLFDCSSKIKNTLQIKLSFAVNSGNCIGNQFEKRIGRVKDILAEEWEILQWLDKTEFQEKQKNYCYKGQAFKMIKKFALDEIRIRRKKFGLTQLQLARQAGVSQSIIAKIEKGRIDPTYSSVVKIKNALDALESKSAKKVEDLMVKKIISAKPSDKIHNVVKLMEKHEISQLPVIENGKVIGSISERTIIGALINKDPDTVKTSKVEKYMEDIPPSVPYGSRIASIIPLFESFSYVLIIKKGNIAGLLAKSDIIREFC